MLSSPKAQPFGLLSNKAVVDFSVGSRAVPTTKYKFKHGPWKTVLQYVYVNMFKDEKYRKQMSEMLAPTPFTNMLHLREQEDNIIYNQEILRGLRERFKQQEPLRARLYQTRGKQLVYDNKEILGILNMVRLQNQQVVFDPKQNREVSRTEVLQVIRGVEDEVARNPSLDDNLSYVDLKRFAKRYGYKDLPLNDDLFLNINFIVPIVKYRMREKLWNQELDLFKDHLLDVFLDYILEVEYPNLDASEYNEAKRQQVAKEPRLQTYKDQLYDLYVKGMKGDRDDHVLEKLRFTPDKALREMGRSAREINEKLLTPEARAEKIYIQEDDPFLPQFVEDVVMDGVTYSSVVHHAYGRMIRNLIEIGELPGLDAFNVNTVSLGDLVTTYNNIKRDWIDYNLKANNEVAIGMKLEQYTTIAHLLLATNQSKLVWNDRTDPVLGVGNDDRGANNTGHLLEYLRNNYRGSQVPNKMMSAFRSIASNVWTNSWAMSMCQDFKNTILLLQSPTVSDLEAIYSITAVAGNPGSDDIVSFHKAGLNTEQIAIVFPLIVALYIPMRGKTESALVGDEAQVYFAENDYRGKRSQFKDDFEVAKVRLERIADLVQLAAGVDKRKFVMSILSNKQTEKMEDARWSRVYSWSH